MFGIFDCRHNGNESNSTTKDYCICQLKVGATIFENHVGGLKTSKLDGYCHTSCMKGLLTWAKEFSNIVELGRSEIPKYLTCMMEFTAITCVRDGGVDVGIFG